MFPDPFIIGKSPLSFSMMVKVPLSTKKSKTLEVAALITSPTRRSMSFVTQRLPLAEATLGGQLGLVPVELVWDGKDQYDQLVMDGSYFYEIQAKVLEDTGNGPQTKVVSRRIQGTLEVLAYVGEVLSPLPPEPEVPAEIEARELKELAEDDSSSLGADVDGKDKGLEGSIGSDSPQESINETLEDLVPEIPGEVLLEKVEPMKLLAVEPEVSLPNLNPTSKSISEMSFDLVPTEPFSLSEELQSQH